MNAIRVWDDFQNSAGRLIHINNSQGNCIPARVIAGPLIRNGTITIEVEIPCRKAKKSVRTFLKLRDYNVHRSLLPLDTNKPWLSWV